MEQKRRRLVVTHILSVSNWISVCLLLSHCTFFINQFRVTDESGESLWSNRRRHEGRGAGTGPDMLVHS